MDRSFSLEVGISSNSANRSQRNLVGWSCNSRTYDCEGHRFGRFMRVGRDDAYTGEQSGVQPKGTHEVRLVTVHFSQCQALLRAALRRRSDGLTRSGKASAPNSKGKKEQETEGG